MKSSKKAEKKSPGPRIESLDKQQLSVEQCDQQLANSVAAIIEYLIYRTQLFNVLNINLN